MLFWQAQVDNSSPSLQRLSSEERSAEMDPLSPASTMSTSSASDSLSLSDAHEEQPTVITLDEQEQQEEEEEEEEEDELPLAGEGLVMLRTIPGSPRSSTSPVEPLEERISSEDCPQSARVYSSPSCKVSTALQRQCSKLWSEFDSIGTEMIVTRRGR